jgi:hypothetical protein
MRTRSVAAALLIAFTPVTFSVPGFAQPSDDPTVKAARARFNEGIEFFDKKDYENARAAFLQAYALRKHPAVLLNLAQSSLRGGHNLEASKFFQQYLKDSSGLTAAQRNDAEKGLAEARTKLGRLEVSAPTGEEIFVDGDHVGPAPLTALVDVEPGSHTVKANSDSKTVNVAVGQIVPVKFAVGGGGGALPVPLPVPGATPTPSDETPPTTSTSPNPTEGQPTPPPPPPADTGGPGLLSPPNSMTPFWIGVSVAGVSGALAVLFAVFKGEANSNFVATQKAIAVASGATTPAEIKAFLAKNGPGTALCAHPSQRFAQACQNVQSDANQVNSDATAANVAIGIGIAGLVFSGVYYFAANKGDSSKPTPPPASSLVPVLEPHYQGMSYTLSF